jgi:hypothetical protein
MMLYCGTAICQMLAQVEAGGVYTFLIVDPDMPSPHKPDMK